MMLRPRPVINDDVIIPDPEVDTPTFLNESQIWPTFSASVAKELLLTIGGQHLTPVPRLESRSESFKPLQLFHDEKDLTGDTFTRLKRKHLKVEVPKNQTNKETEDNDRNDKRIRHRLRVRFRRLVNTMRNFGSRIFSRRKFSSVTVNLSEIECITNIIPEVIFTQSTSRRLPGNSQHRNEHYRSTHDGYNNHYENKQGAQDGHEHHYENYRGAQDEQNNHDENVRDRQDGQENQYENYPIPRRRKSWKKDVKENVCMSLKSPICSFQTRNLNFVLKNVYARKFDARKLLGCHVKLERRFPWKRPSSVHIVLETYIAKRVSCEQQSLMSSHGEDQGSSGWRRGVELEHCPVAFRYAKLKLDRYGVIDDVIMAHH